MSDIHATAIVSPQAELADDVVVGSNTIIEDNVVVTSGECNVLTSGICKTVDEIEALMAA